MLMNYVLINVLEDDLRHKELKILAGAGKKTKKLKKVSKFSKAPKHGSLPNDRKIVGEIDYTDTNLTEE